MKEYLIEKYEGYIKELEADLSDTCATIWEDWYKQTIREKLHAYREILTDLKML